MPSLLEALGLSGIWRSARATQARGWSGSSSSGILMSVGVCMVSQCMYIAFHRLSGGIMPAQGSLRHLKDLRSASATRTRVLSIDAFSREKKQCIKRGGRALIQRQVATARRTRRRRPSQRRSRRPSHPNHPRPLPLRGRPLRP